MDQTCPALKTLTESRPQGLGIIVFLPLPSLHGTFALGGGPLSGRRA